MKTEADTEILARFRDEPEEGFWLLMAAYKEAVYWHIRRLVVSHEDAQDAAQETFVRVFRSLGSFKGDGSLRSWIYRIATNEALRILDRRKDEWVSLSDSPDATGNVSDSAYVDYSDLETVRLQQAILTLPTKQRLTFNLRYYDDMDYREIADVTGSTVAAAKANYHVAKEKIIQYMNSHD